MIFFNILTISAFISLASAIYNCTAPYQCALKAQIPPANSSEGSIDCWGDNSCRQVERIQVSSILYCHGSYSCYNSDTVVSGGIWCYGLYSCAFVSNLTQLGTLFCHGELSCFGSTIYDHANYNLQCYGDRSCSNSIVYGGYEHRIYGHLAAQDSLFFSTQSGATYLFIGRDSGNGAQVICQNGHECVVNCYANACNQLELICDNCTSIDLNCTYAQKSGICNTTGQ